MKYLVRKRKKNIYTIHDCFAVTADKVDFFLINILKGIYIKLYSDETHIVSLHKYIKEKNNSRWACADIFEDNEKYIFVNKERILYPDLKKVIKFKTSNLDLKESSNVLI
jgi:DNA-dependent RNA polymerase